MKVIILGAGQVGGTVAENLAGERNDITVVDLDHDRLRELGDRLDIKTVRGHCSWPSTLRDADAEDADLLVAVTDSDETNMVACQVAYSLFRTPKKVARIRSGQYFPRRGNLFHNSAIPIDVTISPEQIVTDYIRRLIDHPGALQVLNFANGRVQLVAVRAFYGGPLVGNQLRELRRHMPNVDTRVAAIFRRNRPIIPEGDTVIEADDEVFFVAARKDIRAVMSELRRLEHGYKRIVIAGGGNIGRRLAKRLEQRYIVKVIERDKRRSHFLSEELERSVVLLGAATERDILTRANIENTDVFCALTNDDEANIMASLLAKRLGARKVMTLINKPSYVDLVQGQDIDIAISPQQATIGTLLRYVRLGEVVNVHSLRRGAAEAIEAIAKGDRSNSRVVGRRLEEIDLPEGATIGAIVRGEKVLIAHDNVVVEPEDHVILFLIDKRHIRDVERLFQVGFTFF